MHSIAAKDLYAGAVVITDGLRPASIAALDGHGSDLSDGVHLLFEPDEPHLPAPRMTVDPDHVFRLARFHHVAWIIHSRHYRARSATDRAHISVPYAVRGHWAFAEKWSVVDRLAEEHTITTARPIALDALPGPGEPTPAPPNPDSSLFYRFYGQGPTVLTTGDAVRAELARLAGIHRREHGRTDWEMLHRLPGEGDMRECHRCTRTPDDLVPMEVVIERTYRDVTLDDLPYGWDYELGPAMAYERHLSMGTVTRGPRPRPTITLGAGTFAGFPAGSGPAAVRSGAGAR
ncbi:hypothetical protein [Streptomyces sp. WM6378]|uniref:hypothetical protein n=1 Tax=Streptomyces sp. WM6378 TaxID=1415557 RepID=UPI0006AEBED1|nr:hypothetical protein [Streptomyces sp. WM6378]KOU43607.1 hypothetical protein ADK54_17615 [Streptomyces sp. WM6378]